MKKRFWTLLLLSLPLWTGCYKENRETLYPEPACDIINVTYSGTIQPILTQYCAISGCHSGAAPANGMDMSNYGGVRTVALGGRMLGAIRHDSGFSPMPQGGDQLTDCMISKISVWIAMALRITNLITQKQINMKTILLVTAVMIGAWTATAQKYMTRTGKVTFSLLHL